MINEKWIPKLPWEKKVHADLEEIMKGKDGFYESMEGVPEAAVDIAWVDFFRWCAEEAIRKHAPKNKFDEMIELACADPDEDAP